jgi:transcriptional regulator GlxA family with amidase domain
MSIDVWFVMLPGVLSLDMTGPAETFVLAGDAFRLHYIGPQPEVPTSIGLTMSGIQPLPERLPEGSLLVLPGVSDSRFQFSTPQAQQIQHWLMRLQPQIQRQEITVMCVCSGALLAAKSGLLNNRQCTTHHDVISRLRTAAPTATIKENRIFVQDENIWTSAGITSGIDLALHMINRLCGPKRRWPWRVRWWSGSAVLVTIPSYPRGYAIAIIFIRRFIGRRMRSPPSRKKRGACLISPHWRTSARAISPGFSSHI